MDKILNQNKKRNGLISRKPSILERNSSISEVSLFNIFSLLPLIIKALFGVT
jgi:hypothetical protein